VIVEIADPEDPRLDPFRLRERQLGPHRFVAEGDLVVERALDAGCRPVLGLADPNRTPAVVARLAEDVVVYTAGAPVRGVVTGLGVALDVVALFERPDPEDPQTVIDASRRLLVVEEVDNPTNLGAMVRSAAALGWNGLLLDRTSADPLSRRALRTAMGTTFSLRWARVDAVAPALAALTGFTTIGLTPDRDAMALDELVIDPDRPVALVLGAERRGLSGDVLDVVARRVRIPMAAGVDSLNVAAAAAVACYAISTAACQHQR
jgi:tRNA G18 (ribose-2'-O)-methylase SpoU